MRQKIVDRIVHCAATNAEPDIGLRNLEVPDAIMDASGHADCSVYAEMIGAVGSLGWR